jgi:diacylglycerol kinase (ATP)
MSPKTLFGRRCCSPRCSSRWPFSSSPNGLGLALMIGSVLLVLIVELLNSAIEATVDRISLDRHPLAKRAKDIGSAAVLLALLNVLVVWACVLIG